MRLGAALIALAGCLSSVHALQKITKTGKYLYGEDGNRFYIKGIAYQEQGDITSTDPTAFPEPSNFVDPLADAAGCARDLPFLKQLGVNAIRVYSVNASLNHDSCMSALSGAGIYTIIDLSLPVNGSIDRDSPAWSTNLLDLYLGTIEVFSQYDNVLAYNVGNEVANSNVTTVVAPFVKAAARDVKAYLASKRLPQLVGYAAVDAPDVWRFPLAQYLSCGGEAEAIDIYGLNNYEWCGDSTFAAYSNTENTFSSYNIPAYFSEFGCVTSPPRLWTETQALFGSQMTPVWSGGLAFSYFPAFGGFGMVNISTDAKTVTTTADFTRLVTQYSNISFINSPSNSSAGATAYPTCNSPTSQFLASNKLPPTPSHDTCNCLEQTFSCLFTPETTNYTAILGELLDYGCSTLGSEGGNCNEIASNGQTGVYGSVSACDPTIKLSYVMSSLYEAANRNPVTCNFSGNATVNSNAPPSKASAEAAAQSCLSSIPLATFTPSSVIVPGTSSTSKTTSTASNGAKNSSGAASRTGKVVLGFENGVVLSSLGALLFGGLMSGAWVLV